MPNALKHLGFGKWLVVDEDGETVAGPMSKEEAAAFIAPSLDDDEAVAPPPASSPVGIERKPGQSVDDAMLANARIAEREGQRKLDRDFLAEKNRIENRYLTFLVEDFGEDTAARIMRDLAPMLLAGREYRRRERLQFKGRVAKTPA